MRKLKCSECDHVFSEDDAETRKECVGEFWGAPAYMDYNACPECGSTELDEYYENEDEGEEE